jgi:pimeloyl-ACP methyl ester carboxylesterase
VILFWKSPEQSPTERRLILKKEMMLWTVLFLVCAALPVSGGMISPADLSQPVPEISQTLDGQTRRAISGGRGGPDVSFHSLNQTVTVILQDYTEAVRRAHQKAPDTPPTVLGAVRIISKGEISGFHVTVPLIQYAQPGTSLQVVTPNLTGSAWAETDLIAWVANDGLSAVFQAKTQGSYAIYHPESESNNGGYASAPAPLTQIRLYEDGEPWGLISENSGSLDKIPLILVHGDNSFKEPEDRWEYFLDWVSDHPDFDKKYEIWRFHHNTDELIGYDGKSGNAKELGDAITEKFGQTRPILLLAHSRGGLVSRAYMTKYGSGNEGDRVLGLVTLATPHHGSPGAVPDWGLETIRGEFKDTELADILYGFTTNEVVNVSDMGTMGLAWDNFDGPENGISLVAFSLESKLGLNHVLSLMDANIKNSGTDAADPTIYIPDQEFGRLEELNADGRYFGKIIAYGGYDSDLGMGGHAPLNWLNFSFSDHAGLEVATHVMASMKSKGPDGTLSEHHFIANDGMVPMQSAFFLKKDTANEPMYVVDKEKEWFILNSFEVNLKDFLPRMNFRKAVVCPDFDHLHMIEGKGGIIDDRSDYWNHVAASLNQLAALSPQDAENFTPEAVTFSASRPSFSEVVSGSNCFIQSLTGIDVSFLWKWLDSK